MFRLRTKRFNTQYGYGSYLPKVMQKFNVSRIMLWNDYLMLMLFKLQFYVKLLLKTCFTKLLLNKFFDFLFKNVFPLSSYRLWVSVCWTCFCQKKLVFSHERKRFIKNIVMFYKSLYFHVLKGYTRNFHVLKGYTRVLSYF